MKKLFTLIVMFGMLFMIGSLFAQTPEEIKKVNIEVATERAVKNAEMELALEKINEEKQKHELIIAKAERDWAIQIADARNKGAIDATTKLLQIETPNVMIYSKEIGNPYDVMLKTLEQDRLKTKQTNKILFGLHFLSLVALYFIVFKFISGEYKIVKK